MALWVAGCDSASKPQATNGDEPKQPASGQDAKAPAKWDSHQDLFPRDKNGVVTPKKAESKPAKWDPHKDLF